MAESNYHDALTLYTEALDIYTQTSHASGMIHATLMMAKVYRKQGDLTQAIELCSQSLKRSEEETLFLLRVDCLTEMGVIADLQGDVEKARVHYQQSLHVAQEIGDDSREESAHRNLGIFTANLESTQKPKKNSRVPFPLPSKSAPDCPSVLPIVIWGTSTMRLEIISKRSLITRKALPVQEIGNKQSACANLGDIGNIHQHLGEFEQAISHYQQARRISVEIGDRKTESLQAWKSWVDLQYA